MIRKGMQKQKYEYKPTDTPDKQYKFFKDYYDKAKLVNEDDDMWSISLSHYPQIRWMMNKS